MGLISRALDGLPVWAKGILGFLVAIGSIYCIARDGFWSFLLRLIFTPVP